MSKKKLIAILAILFETTPTQVPHVHDLQVVSEQVAYSPPFEWVECATCGKSWHPPGRVYLEGYGPWTEDHKKAKRQLAEYERMRALAE